MQTAPDAKVTVHNIDVKGFSLPCFVQRYCVINGIHTAGVSEDSTLRIRKFGDPLLIDAFSFGSAWCIQHQLNQWSVVTPGEGAADFCISRPSLLSKQTFKAIEDRPVYLALQDLYRDGWKAGREKNHHTATGTKRIVRCGSQTGHTMSLAWSTSIT